MPQAVYGVQFGYKGFFELPLRELTLETVAYIHKVLAQFTCFTGTKKYNY